MRPDPKASFELMINRERYLAHLHTYLTDGENTVTDICRWATEHRYESAVFSEHIRRNPGYSFDAYATELESMQDVYPPLDIWTGVEAKVELDGSLDCDRRVLERIDVLYIACHGFAGNVDDWAYAMRAAFDAKHSPDLIRVWAHPGRFLVQRNLLDEHVKLLQYIIEYARDSGVYIENNLRDGLPPSTILGEINKAGVITGIDAHSMGDLERFDSLKR